MDYRTPVVDEFTRVLQDGKPELGWEGDPDLALALNEITQQWELLRHAPVRGYPDRYVVEATTPVGAPLNEDALNKLIRNLVARSRRHHGSEQEWLDGIMAENDRMQKEKAVKAAETETEILQKFYHEAGKELGVPRTFFGDMKK